MSTGHYDKDILHQLKSLNRTSGCCCSPGNAASIGVSSTSTAGTELPSSVLDATVDQQLRAIEIIPISGGTPGTGTDGLATIQITKADGSVLTFIIRHDMVWNYQGAISAAPITNILVANDDAAAPFNFILNVSSI